MEKYDVIVIGAGVSGLFAASVLGKEKKKVLLVETMDRPGGRAAIFDYKGFKLSTGLHLEEDTGSGTSRILQYLGKTLEKGPQNDNMPVFHEGKWMAMHEVIGENKAELKKVIKELVNTDYEEFEKFEHIPLREWIYKITDSEEVVKLFEFLAMVEGATTDWRDHCASENLWVRKMHYAEQKTAGYSFYPKQGWQGFFQMMEDIVKNNNVTISYNTEVTEIVVENEGVQGIRCLREKKQTPNEFIMSSFIAADHVICTVPVWQVLPILPEDKLPVWFIDKVKLYSKGDHRAVYLGLYIASKEPIYVLSERELAAWFEGPVSGFPGWGCLNDSMDPNIAPPGHHLWVCGSYVDKHIPESRKLTEKAFEEFEKDLEIMLPAVKNSLWRQRHVVYQNSYVASITGLMGVNRPGVEVPGAKGLYFGGDSYQGRSVGLDKAARQGLACAERALGYRIEGLEDVFRV